MLVVSLDNVLHPLMRKFILRCTAPICLSNKYAGIQSAHSGAPYSWIDSTTVASNCLRNGHGPPTLGISRISDVSLSTPSLRLASRCVCMIIYYLATLPSTLSPVWEGLLPRWSQTRELRTSFYVLPRSPLICELLKSTGQPFSDQLQGFISNYIH